MRIVTRCEASAGDLVPAMRFQRDVARNHESRAMADDLAVKFGNKLAVGEIVDLTPHHALGVPRRRGINSPAERRHGGYIGQACLPYDQRCLLRKGFLLFFGNIGHFLIRSWNVPSRSI